MALVIFNLCTRQEGEDFQTVDHVGIVGVDPELIERVGRAHFSVKPNGVTLTLAKLRAVRVRDEWRADCVRTLTVDSANEVGAAREVAPLVAAARLQHTVIVAV